MLTDSELINLDLKHLWHPASQMKDYENFPPLVVVRAQGSYLELADGRKIIDANSSWWCKLLGHNHPRLKAALLKQVEQFEHVILANTTNQTIAQLSAELAQLVPSLNKVFYASDGACAVEIALKMSLHARRIRGEMKRTHFISLTNSYHGETVGAMSVSDLGTYRDAYQPLLFNTHFLTSIPYVNNIQDPLWLDCADAWGVMEQSLLPYRETATAVIVEPIVQGAGNLRIYSQDLLKRLRAWTQVHGVHLIADEIVTGLGRTGKMLACEHSGIEPDFLCLGKGLTGGWLPLSAVVTRDDIYQLFYADYSENKHFPHSHTFSGNALAAAIALQVLRILKEENICEKALVLEQLMAQKMQEIADDTKLLKNVRHIGAIVATDLVCLDHQRRGFEVYKKAVELGALLRHIGNTVYWFPPLNIDEETINKLAEITRDAVLS